MTLRYVYSALTMTQRTKLQGEFNGHRAGMYRAIVREVYVDSGATKRIAARLQSADYQDLLAQLHGFLKAGLPVDCRQCLDHLRNCVECQKFTN